MIASGIGLLLVAAWIAVSGLAVWMTVSGVKAARAAALDIRAATPLTLVVTERSDHGRFARIVLTAPGGDGRLPRYSAGDYLTVLASPQGQRPQRRCYSLAGWQASPDSYELLVKREENGLVSGWIHDVLQVGARIEALGPRGGFHLTEHRGERLLVAAGVGITPLRAMLHRISAGRTMSPTTLFWSVRHVTELECYHPEFLDLSRTCDWFRYVPCVTRPGPGWRGTARRLDAGIVLAARRNMPLAGVWICASATMTRQLTEDLAQRGVPADRIHFELFGADAAGAPAEVALVTVQPGGRCANYLGEPTLLHCLEREGIPISSDCRAGHCGACRMQLVGGRVDTVLPPQMAVPESQVLTCCVRPASDIVIAFPDR
ncbi:ferredoxin-NADP reductase [Tepidamorphus gemmatus]|uniref:Ferredoxin-NADP reductase n=1 Tax=Tepidamorphus gemmatus TaxID=747076 RepID=A0A4R3MAW3_9HYPH|nr:ferredoxin-NADP reductase [Tepidamorphus gemmatus]